MPAEALKRERAKKPARITWGKFRLDIGKKTCIMGILNRTPDSFSDGGNFMRENDAVSRALEMANEGADIIDIGGESTRPGSMPVEESEELDRVIPVIERLKGNIDLPISIDTNKSRVAEAAIKSGAAMINDVTGLRNDPGIADVAAKYDIPLVVTHIKGTPRTMQIDPRYEDLIGEIIAGLEKSVSLAKKSGMDNEKIIVDPGIGFGKKMKHNLKIIRELGKIKNMGKAILIGVSRKSFIGHLLGPEEVKRFMGTAAGVAAAIINGADIVRVHDVKEMKILATMVDAICMS